MSFEPQHHKLNWSILGATFPDRYKAKGAHEALQRETFIEDANISAWRFASVPPGTDETHPDAEHRVVVIAETDETIRQAIRVCSRFGGEPWDVPEDLIEALANRRLRVLVQEGKRQADSGEPLHAVRQKAHYGKGGLVTPEGEIQPYKRPQG